jgi:hypothetical protein
VYKGIQKGVYQNIYTCIRVCNFLGTKLLRDGSLQKKCGAKRGGLSLGQESKPDQPQAAIQVSSEVADGKQTVALVLDGQLLSASPQIYISPFCRYGRIKLLFPNIPLTCAIGQVSACLLRNYCVGILAHPDKNVT